MLDYSYRLIIDNYSDDMLSGLLEGLGKGHCRVLRRLVISGMCLEPMGAITYAGS